MRQGLSMMQHASPQVVVQRGIKPARTALILALMVGWAMPHSTTSLGQTFGEGDRESQKNQVPKGNTENRPNTDSGQGGGSFADFQSLIDLIQTTIVPDTWEALGGPSTMAPYPQGVYVDPSGTLRDCQPFSQEAGDLSSISLEKIADSIPMKDRIHPGMDAWKEPAKLRFVSLNRLTSQWSEWRQSGRSPSEAMQNLAGLSEVQAIFLNPSDIILAGRVNGITQKDGWFRDQATHRNTLQLLFLRNTLWSSQNRRPFGCTIDPTREGLQQAAAVGQKIQQKLIPILESSEALVSALGMQRVEVFGIPGDTPIGYLMVEADRHMKQLALGLHPMPGDTMNYLDAIDEFIDQGPPQELLLRLWFTAERRKVFTNQEQTVFELVGNPIRLSSENEHAQQNGNRGAITRDFRTEAFVTSFNEDWRSIREEYPIYGAIESVFEAASIAQLMVQQSKSPTHLRILENLSIGATETQAILSTPRQVSSIGQLHSVRHGNKKHHVLLASGGVFVDPAQTLGESLVRYPLNFEKSQRSDEVPRIQQRWWWDMEKPLD